MFKYLAECVTSIDAEKQVISTHGKQVSYQSRKIGWLAEEADTKMFLHAVDAVQSGFNKILLRTFDTDVFILAVVFLEK